MRTCLSCSSARRPGRRAPNLKAQQRVLNTFRENYNCVRPHEAINGAVPNDLYRPSPRPFPTKLQPLVYPAHFEVRRVSRNGGIRWYSRWVNVSNLLGEQHVGFEDVDAGMFDVYFDPVWLGRFFESKMRIFDNLGRAKRRRGGNFKGKNV